MERDETAPTAPHRFDLPQRDPCPFCENVVGSRECAVVEDGDAVLAFLNPRQFTAGAMLVIPKRHAPTVLELGEAEAALVMRCVVRVARAVAEALRPDGLNIFQNNGLVGGQSVPHVHVHVLPRYRGDGWDLGVSSAQFPITPMTERLRLAERIKACL